MVTNTKLNMLYNKSQKWSSYLLLIFLATTLVLTSSFDNPPGIKVTTKVKTIRVGGDFSLDFVASAPYTYDHKLGGGAFDNRTVGKDQDIVESLEGGDFACGDRVSFLTQIVVSDQAIGTQSIQLDYSFLSHATGQPGVALAEPVYVLLNNYAPIQFDGQNIGERNDFGDAGYISNNNESFSIPTAFHLTGGQGNNPPALFVKPATTDGTVQINGLEAGEHIILRIDVTIKCQPGSSATGNLQASIMAGRVVDPVFANRNDRIISVGQQTVPFKNVDLIFQAECTLDDFVDVCAGDIKNYTASAGATFNPVYTWSLVGDAVFVDANGATITNPGNSATARVKATAPSGTTGCYKVSVEISADQHTPTTCCDLVTVYAIPPAPTVSITEPTLCSTATATVTVLCPLNPSTGDPIYEYRNGSGAWQTSPVFAGLAAGSQFSITVRRIGTTCTSAATDCTNYSTRTCTTPTVTSCSLTAGCTTAAAIQKATPRIETESSVLAAPNPYNSSVNFKFVAPVSGKATLELYDLVGRRIAIVYQGQVDGGRQKSVDYKVPTFQKVPMIYKLTINGKSRTGKLLPANTD